MSRRQPLTTMNLRKRTGGADRFDSPTEGNYLNPMETPEMKWETPTACDFRFGFEITMYIAAR